MGKYEQCEDPYKKVLILEKIVNIQPYLSSFYQSTVVVMKTTEEMRMYEKLKNLPPPAEICKCGHKRTEHQWVLGQFHDHFCHECECKDYDQVQKSKLTFLNS